MICSVLFENGHYILFNFAFGGDSHNCSSEISNVMAVLDFVKIFL
jgi:hypothetical protein